MASATSPIAGMPISARGLMATMKRVAVELLRPGLLLAALGCHAPAEHPRAAAPEKTLPLTPYAVARAQFHTHLVKHAPLSKAPSAMPADARGLDYESDGLSLTAWVSRPPSGARHPAVIVLDGGPAVGAADWQRSQPFRDAGFVVMLPILRGENGRPGDYSMFYDEVDDVLAAAEALARLPDVDADRIYLAGHSAGGTQALLAALASHRFRAVASFSRSPDFAALVSLPGADDVVPYAPGDPDEIRLRSPQAFATSFPCPVRLFWGTEEPGVADDNRGTLQRSSAVGLDVVGIEVPGGHVTMMAAAIPLAIEFFREH